MLAPPPPALVRLALDVERAGGRALAVGGSVRDALLDRVVVDWDVEVYGLEERVLERLLRKHGPVNAVGRAFGVFKVVVAGLDVDVSLPRTDSKAGPGHKGIAVCGDPALSIAEASRRRDLTVNALLRDLITGELVDPHGGLEDLRAKRLRAVDEDTFLEDPLRALRVLQFASRLRFEPDAALVRLCEEAALEELPAERVGEEWRKLLLTGVAPSLGLDIAWRAGVHARLFPGVPRAPDGALEGLLGHRDALGPARGYALMVAAWARGSSAEDLTAALDRLAIFRWLHLPIRELVLAANRERATQAATDAGLRRLAAKAPVDLVLLGRWAHGEAPDALERLARAVELGVGEQAAPRLLLGRHLVGRVAPGPAMGQWLERAYEAQLDGAFGDELGALAWLEAALSRPG